ncbi:hypothetical protein OsJ_10864 [Oryza sativa Japonica Group]|uniref:Uncharacterized protein n=1 Tax=Oryza sativa subsp. japonica TaxID=39947 RepID=B9F8G8_ORYSJ|nr:hypothetical protein OsJ_10864 [Oryza sativa Japonica Group]
MAASSYDGVVALWLLWYYDEEAWECVCTRVAAGFLDRRRGRDDGVLRRPLGLKKKKNPKTIDQNSTTEEIKGGFDLIS